MLKPIWNVLFAAALLLFLMGSAVASQVFENAESAKQAAQNYSAQSGGVGVVIFYGTENRITADELGASFNKEIKRRGHQSQYFVINGEHVGVGILYRVGEWNSGLLDTSAAVAAMDTVIEKAAVHARIVFLEARMAASRAKLIEKYGEDYLEEMEKRWLNKDER